MRLNDAHLVLLSAAVQRGDKLLLPPEKLGQKVAEKLGSRFEAAGLVEAVPVTAHQPHWRTTPEGEPIGLRVTPSGLEALGIEGKTAPATTELAEDVVPDAADASPATEMGGELPGVVDTSGIERPRPGSKRALLIEMLGREEGASIEAIMTVMGWLPHSTRAALTGLRKAGYLLVKSKDATGTTSYRRAEVTTAASDQVSEAAE